jgi:hypothetical protein
MLSMLCLMAAWRMGVLKPAAAQVKQVPRRPTGIHFSKTLSLGHLQPFVLVRPLGLPAWDTSVLASQQDMLTGVLTSPEPEFGPAFDASRPLARLNAEIRPRHKYTEINMTARKFFARAATAHHQYSQPVSLDISPDLRPQFEYLEKEIVAIYPQVSSVTLDLDREDAVTPCHYSSEHTIVALSDGSKKFLMIPPGKAATMRVFPHLHPSAGWCRSRLSTAPDPVLAGAKAVQVTLAPGELLYIPPMWMVEAVAERPTVSVVGHVQSDPQRASLALRALGRPSLGANTGGEVIDGEGLYAAGLAAWFTGEISARVLGSHAGLGAVVYCSRYQWLVQEGELPDLGAGAGGKDLLPPPLCAARVTAAAASGDSRARWDKYVFLVEAALGAGGMMDAGVRPTLLADLVEEIAAEAVPMAGLPAFWRELYACDKAAVPGEAAGWVPRC